MTEPVRPLTAVEHATRLLRSGAGSASVVADLLNGVDAEVLASVTEMNCEPVLRNRILRLLRGVQALGDAGVMTHADPGLQPIRATAELPRIHQIPFYGWFSHVTVELPPGRPTSTSDLARQLAEGLAREETTLVFPPGATVTYGTEPTDPVSLTSVTDEPVPTAADTVRVAIFTTSGEALTIERMPLEDANALVEVFRHPGHLGPAVLTVVLDDNAVSHLARAQIVRIDLDFGA